MNRCPDCRNLFVQPFTCTTCGAQKLYDETVRSLHGRCETLEARLAEALRVLDTIDDEGDDHYYGIADRARLVLRGIVTMSEQNCMSVNCIAEYGWVIEGGWTDIDKPEYWVGSSAWSGDHMRALRFARRQDAQQAADLMLAGVNVRICEHEWAPARYVLICGVDCHPGDANCNNYCNLAPQKGPMAAYPPKGPDA